MIADIERARLFLVKNAHSLIMPVNAAVTLAAYPSRL